MTCPDVNGATGIFNTAMNRQAQAEAIQADVAKKAAELQLKRENDVMIDARERERIAQDGALKRYELELKYQTDINDQQMQRDIADAAEQTRRAAQVEQSIINALTPPPQPNPGVY